MNKEDKLNLINDIFCPTAPIERPELFCGREAQIERILYALQERGQHIVMYGPRGVGKTSLANIVALTFKGINTIKITCNRTDNFRTLWEKILSRITLVTPSKKRVGFNSVAEDEYVTFSLPEGNIDSTTIEQMFSEIEMGFLFIFDEFDSIVDSETRTKMADTMKMLSDNVQNITIMMVGIASSIKELMGDHPSLERCISQVEMPLMSEKEITAIINNIKLIGLIVEPEVVKKIVEESSGYPHYVHLLCKFCARKAVTSGAKVVLRKHLDWAVEQSIDNSNSSLKQSYQKAIAGNKNQFANLLLACALAPTDEYNSFAVDTVFDMYNLLSVKKDVKIESVSNNLTTLCKEERGEVLQKWGKLRDKRYRFKNPLMKAFIKLSTHETDK